MTARKVSSRVRASVLAIFVLSCLALVRAADEPVDMQRVRELRARVQKRETLTPEEQAYYDRGLAEYQQRQRKGKETNSNSKAPQSETKAPQKVDDASQGKQAENAFTLSEEISPLESFEVTSPAGVKVVGIMRKPPGNGPLPAVLFLHGGLVTRDMDLLRDFATRPTASRFVAAGYLVVVPTFRERETNPQTRDVLDDCLTVIDWVKHRSDVDPKSVVVWGFSAGGNEALELAGETDLAVVICEEPATILTMLGTMKKLSDKNPVQVNPKQYWTPDLQEMTRKKVRKIHCPVFIAYGESSNLNMLNEDILFSELKAAGKEFKTKFYPGQWHGFSRHSKEFFDDAFAFFGKSIVTAPRPISQETKQTQKQAKTAPTSNEAKPAPDLANIAYGPEERNVFDLWKAKSDTPTPLVVYIHGGGFKANSKESVSPQLLKACLDSGISVAAINYRLSPQYHFPDHYMDSARAIQFLRSKAKEYNLDPQRVAATGASAGTGTSLWIAFHDDMADPHNPDPVLRESTRLTCAAVVDAQSTYDPRVIKQIIGGNGELFEPLFDFYGLEPEEVDSDRAHKLYEAASPITYATADDPPVWMHYREAKARLPDNARSSQGGHHPNFGYSLKDKLDKLGVGCIVRHASEYPGQRTPIRAAERGTSGEMVDFFKRQFGMR